MYHGVEDEMARRISIGSIIESSFNMLANINVKIFDQRTQTSSKDPDSCGSWRLSI
jgi:hypothetical protein